MIRLSSAALPVLYRCKISPALAISSGPITVSAATPAGALSSPSPCKRLCMASSRPVPGLAVLTIRSPSLMPPGFAWAGLVSAGACCAPAALAAIAMIRSSFSPSCSVFGCCPSYLPVIASPSAYTRITRMGLRRASMSSGSSRSTTSLRTCRGLMGFSISTYRHSS